MDGELKIVDGCFPIGIIRRNNLFQQLWNLCWSSVLLFYECEQKGNDCSRFICTTGWKSNKAHNLSLASCNFSLSNQFRAAKSDWISCSSHQNVSSPPNCVSPITSELLHHPGCILSGARRTVAIKQCISCGNLASHRHWKTNSNAPGGDRSSEEVKKKGIITRRVG